MTGGRPEGCCLLTGMLGPGVRTTAPETFALACSERSLHIALAQHAPVKDIRLVLDRFTGAPRGFAFVHFHSVADASRVLHALQVIHCFMPWFYLLGCCYHVTMTVSAGC